MRTVVRYGIYKRIKQSLCLPGYRRDFEITYRHTRRRKDGKPKERNGKKMTIKYAVMNGDIIIRCLQYNS